MLNGNVNFQTTLIWIIIFFLQKGVERWYLKISLVKSTKVSLRQMHMGDPKIPIEYFLYIYLKIQSYII